MKDSQPVSDVDRLAESLAPLPNMIARPVLVALYGLPGTGKSHLASTLAGGAGLVVLESDALRKVLFPTPAYSVEESERLFHAIHGLIERMLTHGVSVILDATSLAERHREDLYRIAGRDGARVVLIEVTAPRRVVSRRLADRHSGRHSGRPGSSDADWDVYLRMAGTAEGTLRRHYTVDTSGDNSRLIDEIVTDIRSGPRFHPKRSSIENQTRIAGKASS